MDPINLISLFDIVRQIDVEQFDRFAADLKIWHAGCQKAYREQGEVYPLMSWRDDGTVGQLPMYAIGEKTNIGFEYWDGPTPDLDSMVKTPGRTDNSRIVKFVEGKDIEIHAWDTKDNKWHVIALREPVVDRDEESYDDHGLLYRKEDHDEEISGIGRIGGMHGD